MESREILVANTKTQRRSKITTGAETLGELKEALDQAGIDYTGLSFTEGITKTGLLDDATQLPRDVMYKGSPTNNLVIILTNTEKKIESGEGTRQEAYAIIRENDFQDAVRAAFGCNYTNVSTANLWQFIDENLNEDEPEDDELDDEEEEDHDLEDDDNGAVEAAYSIYEHIKTLVYAGVLSVENLKAIQEMLEEFINRVSEVTNTEYKVGDSTISDNEIDDMINSL